MLTMVISPSSLLIKAASGFIGQNFEGTRRARRLAGLVVLAFGLTSVGSAQQTANKPTTAAQTAQQEGAAQADRGDMGQTTEAPQQVLHLSARRVLVDVVVTDSKGNPIPGLSQDDFKVLENGAPQQVHSFDVHTSETATPLPSVTLPPNTFSNLSTAPQSGQVTVILYDLLNTPIDAQPFARAQLLQFLKSRSDSSEVAIFVLSDKLHMLQGFTDKDDLLIAALNRQNSTMYKSSYLLAPGEATQQSDDLAKTEGNQDGADAVQDVSFQAISRMLSHMETIDASALMDQRVFITTEAMEEIARFLVGLPGRKNLLWLSGAFPEGILPDASLGGRDSFDVTRNYSSTLVEVTDLLNLSHVAVYPVDARGLQVNPMYSASSNQTFEPGTKKNLKAVQDFSLQNNAEHATMDAVADDTGGQAFYNTNGLKEAVSTAMKEGAVYYTLSYAPSNPKLDGGVRHVRVELTKPELRNAGYQLSYRRTYFADDVDAAVAHSEDTPNDPLAQTLEHGAPEAHQLFFEVHLLTYGTPTVATPEQMDTLAKYEAMNAGQKKHKVAMLSRQPVMMQRYLIEYGLLLRQLQTALGNDGTRNTDLDFAVMSFDGDGNTLNGVRSEIRDAMPPERYERLLKGAYQVVQTVALPVQAAFLRVAVRDVGSNQMGSIEIQLPLAPAPPVAAGAAPVVHTPPPK
jgi:VWFA-related protein